MFPGPGLPPPVDGGLGVGGLVGPGVALGEGGAEGDKADICGDDAGPAAGDS
ncbi:MAG TPA: hypothetical protein VFC00_02355 [Micromonosporaceae bacterium]|nr:hypothetical protein [Micromonosporaceae bacterium]